MIISKQMYRFFGKIYTFSYRFLIKNKIFWSRYTYFSKSQVVSSALYISTQTLPLHVMDANDVASAVMYLNHHLFVEKVYFLCLVCFLLPTMDLST